MIKEDKPILCECCGGNIQECICEFGEAFVQETPEHIANYIEFCLIHDTQK